MKKKAHNGLGNHVFYLVPLAFCLGTSAPVGAAPLKAWQYDPTANQLEIILKDGVKPRYFLMARPARIVLDLPDTEVGDVQRQQTYEGAVRQVRVSQVKPGLARIVLELSPDTTLMRGQAQLQRVGDAEPSSDRWVLRPLIAQALTNPPTAIPSLPPVPAAQLSSPAIQYPPGTSPRGTGASEPRQSGRAIAPVSDKPIDIVVPPPVAPAPVLTNPPPTTVPLVVAESASSKVANLPTPPAPENFPPGIAPNPEQTVTKPTPAISSSPPQTLAVKPAARVAQKPAPSLQLPEINPSLAIPDSLPPVTAPNVQSTPTVSVPPLGSRVSPIPFELPPSSVATPSPPGSPPLQPPAPNLVADRQSVKSQATTIEFGQPMRSGHSNMIEFGQPLPAPPGRERSPSQSPSLISYNSALLPAGTVLSLRYPGTQALPLSSESRQEVLLLQSDLRDRSGRLIASEGTEVLGKFENSGGGSRFVAQAILLQGQNVAIAAQSDVLGGTRKVADNRLIRNSGIGALAGAILGGLSGGNVVGGAAAGAAVTYATAPKSATIQPGQILDVRLTEDFK